MIKTNLAIIGGGASGLICASYVKNKDVIILEKNDKIGKKILVTGNGRCNLSNKEISAIKYNTTKVENFFNKFSQEDTIEYFKSLGLLTYADEENRIYPISNTANSVLDVLRLNIEKSKVNIKCNVNIINLIKKENLFEITLSTNEKIQAKNVLIACGGNSNLDFLKGIKLNKTDYSPSLSALKTSHNKGLTNIKVSNVKVTLITKNEKFIEEGEILFKENSISGIAIFNLSSHLARQKDYNACLSINFLPKLSFNEIFDMLKSRQTNLSNLTIKDFFTGLFHKTLGQNLLEKANLNLNNNITSLTDKDLKILTNLITNYTVQTFAPCDNNQVFSGGINLESLSPSLESLTCKNLYFSGEVVNVDGECGGYNLQWCWTSGIIVAKDIDKKSNTNC